MTAQASDHGDGSPRDSLRAAADTMRAVRERIGTGKDLAWVLFCGGGAIAMRAQLARRYPHCRFPDHPQFANARGMLKIAKYIFAQKD